MQREPTFSVVACITPDDDDRALVEQFRGGDRDAFTALIVRHQRALYNAAFWITKRPEDASDVAQASFVKAAEHIDDYDPRYKFFSWIYRIAVNEALNQVRQRRHEDPLDDDNEPQGHEGSDPAAQFAERQRAQHLHAAMMKLSTSDRTVLTMRHFAELSYAEMAEVLEIEEKTVKSRLFDARHRLRQMLGDL